MRTQLALRVLGEWDSFYLRSNEEVTADGYDSDLAPSHLRRHGPNPEIEPVLTAEK